MHLPQLFYRAPWRFDASALVCEIAALPDTAWHSHFRDLPGTASLALIGGSGGPGDLDTPPALLPVLDMLPAVKAVLTQLGVPVRRARLLRLAPGGGYPPQADREPYWRNRLQLIAPLVVPGGFTFYCARQPFAAAPGEVFAYDNASMHRFVNDARAPSLHLIVDVPGSAAVFAALSSGTMPPPGLQLDAADALPPVRVPGFDRPVFIVAAPRSGSTLLFETLAVSRSWWTLGGEGGAHVETIAALAPQTSGPQSNRLTAENLTGAIGARLTANYAADLRLPDGAPWRAGGPDVLRFLEKTPKNALRIPFFKALFPDAKFIFLHRDARANTSAIIEAWRSGKFVTYTNMPGWPGAWSLLLIPAWRELCGAPLGRVALRQWSDTNRIILDDLKALPPQDWCSVGYEDLVRDPAATVARLTAFAGVERDASLVQATAGPLKLSRYTLSKPDPEKWRRNEAVFAPYLEEAGAVTAALAALEQ